MQSVVTIPYVHDEQDISGFPLKCIFQPQLSDMNTDFFRIRLESPDDDPEASSNEIQVKSVKLRVKKVHLTAGACYCDVDITDMSYNKLNE